MMLFHYTKERDRIRMMFANDGEVAIDGLGQLFMFNQGNWRKLEKNMLNLIGEKILSFDTWTFRDLEAIETYLELERMKQQREHDND